MKSMIHRPIDKDSIIKIWQDLGEPYPTTDNLMKIRQLTGYGLYSIKETIVNFVQQKSAEWLKTF